MSNWVVLMVWFKWHKRWGIWRFVWISSTPICHKATGLCCDRLPLVQCGIIRIQKVCASGIQQVGIIWRQMQQRLNPSTDHHLARSWPFHWLTFYTSKLWIGEIATWPDLILTNFWLLTFHTNKLWIGVNQWDSYLARSHPYYIVASDIPHQ